MKNKEEYLKQHTIKKIESVVGTGKEAAKKLIEEQYGSNQLSYQEQKELNKIQ